MDASFDHEGKKSMANSDSQESFASAWTDSEKPWPKIITEESPDNGYVVCQEDVASVDQSPDN